jgi:hypothetical protein
MPKRKPWIAASGTIQAVSRFGSRPAVWSLSSCQNVSFGSLRAARLFEQLHALAPDPLSGACPHAKTLALDRCERHDFYLEQLPLWLQTRCLEPVLTPKRKLWIAASGIIFSAASRFGSRPAVWSLSSRQNVSFGSLRTARIIFRVSRFGSRPDVWSLSSRQNLSFGSLRAARLPKQCPASAPDPLSGACPHAKT